jgi:hypothetical protein
VKTREPRTIPPAEAFDTDTLPAIASGAHLDPWLDYLADLLAREFLREIAKRST